MSALARYFKQQGKEVSGYDRTETSLTKQLESEGMNIHYTDDPAFIPCDSCLVIYTPAIPGTNRELQYCLEGDFTVMKRAEVLGLLSASFNTIAIAGTHGKTSISSMIAHIMHANEYAVTALVGGIMTNYDSNIIRAYRSKYLVVEADEYDRSFLKLHPWITVVSTLSADHLDIYGSLENMRTSFREFIGKTNPDGKVILHEDVVQDLAKPGNMLTYGNSEGLDIIIRDIRVVDHHFHFELSAGDQSIDIKMLVPGKHNIANAAAAAAVCMQTGLDLTEIKMGLESYLGVKRRFEYIIDDPGKTVFIDDYAHHPDELQACISTARELYPEKKITGIFQPHLYTRTRDFAVGFAKALDVLDEVILMDVYPAREEPIDGVSADIIFEIIQNSNKSICSKEELVQKVVDLKPEVLLTMGAGDIDQCVQPIKEALI